MNTPRIINVPALTVWGQGIRTINANGQSLRDQGALWARLMTENFLAPLPRRDQYLYGLYHAYEGDHTRPFSFTIAAEPDPATAYDGRRHGLTEHTVIADRYAVFSSRRGPPEEVVGDIWREIWQWSVNAPERRAFTQDYERYDSAEMASGQISVEVFIALA